ncbi:MAG: radical SAM protein [Candidatus Omnitrophica bacterium]|nr:radical SAM protein [Candidatus Omnitrophota bacterium]
MIRGEGEDAFCQLVNNFSNKDFSGIDGLCWKKDNEIIRNNQRKNYLALDQIPFPAWDLLPMDKYIYHWYYLDSVDTGCRGTTMIASRGCPFSCSYCQPTLREIFGKEVRLRSPVNVVEEIKELKSRYGINGVFFHDDTMTMNHKWLGDFCRLMSSHKGGVLWSCNSRVDTVNEDILKMMYDAGLRNIHFGIEAGSQRILNQVYNKKIRLDQAKDIIDIADRIGISTMGFFMLGAPSETEEEIRSTMRLARNLRLDEASFSLVTPLAGTDLFNSVIKDARYTIKNDSSALNYYSHYAIEGGIEESRIKFLQLKALILFYTHPRRLGYILRHALSIKGMSKLLNKIRRFF